jgi:hypothetical protein
MRGTVASRGAAAAESGSKTSTCPAGAERRYPVADGAAGLLRDLELHRPAGLFLFLHYTRSIANSVASEHIIDPQSNEVASPELVVDGQIEHRKIALAVLQLEANANGPNVLRFQRTLLADQACLIPRIPAPRR